MKTKPMTKARGLWLKGLRTHLRKLRLRAIVEKDKALEDMYDESLGIVEATLTKHGVKF